MHAISERLSDTPVAASFALRTASNNILPRLTTARVSRRSHRVPVTISHDGSESRHRFNRCGQPEYCSSSSVPAVDICRRSTEGTIQVTPSCEWRGLVFSRNNTSSLQIQAERPSSTKEPHELLPNCGAKLMCAHGLIY
jgi:hypothetical protein